MCVQVLPDGAEEAGAAGEAGEGSELWQERDQDRI